jgi:multidrug efflux pump subunit AcrA (membrane-fusion protein)
VRRVQQAAALVAAAVVLGLAACERHAPPGAPPAPPPAVRDVRVETVAAVAVRDWHDAVGTVRSKAQMLVASRTQGFVREVRVWPGDHVEPGQLLVVVDQREPAARLEKARAAEEEALAAEREARRALEEAEAGLRVAEADHRYADATARRFRSLYERELVSAQDWEGAEARRRTTLAAVEQAQARIESARAREQQTERRIAQARAEREAADVGLGDMRIVAPAAGVVVERRAQPGDVALPGQALLVLEDPLHYRFEAVVGESRLGQVALGQALPVTLDAVGRTLSGRVAEIVPAADPDTRTVTVRLDLPRTGDLRSGLFGRLRLPGPERQALLVPASAVVERGQLTHVVAVDDQNVARLRLVTLGPRDGGRVEVLSGLNAGERVVAAGAERIADGSRVEPAS